jgi:methylated-DNA-[protein]-cysteine S-methyltransferase
MTPYRFFTETFDTPTGLMRLVTDEAEQVRVADWEDHSTRYETLMRRHYGDGVQLTPRGGASPARRALEGYFAGALDALGGLQTATGGTDFQRAVWAALRTIPVGCTMSYGALAARIGRPKATRAVGLANGANPIAVIVPCHRVIGADKSLTGFGGGLERKSWLLAHEEGTRPVKTEAQGRLFQPIT